MKCKCVDAGTVNCPCVMAETKDCLVCGKLFAGDVCDCKWTGVCIYNEFVQNGCKVRDNRETFRSKILNKKYYGEDVFVTELEVPKGFALQAYGPGTFVFVKPEGENDYYNMPVSVMMADHDSGKITIAVKIISAKSKKLDDASEWIEVRGMYRNGLLGKGTQRIQYDKKNGGKWLVVTKGIGIAPAVKLLSWAGENVKVDLTADIDKISEEFLEDCLAGFRDTANIRIKKIDLANSLDHFNSDVMDQYDRIIILTSNYFIKTIADKFKIPEDKLVYCNNFNMCCGEGICGACCYTNSKGEMYKACKCRI